MTIISVRSKCSKQKPCKSHADTTT